MIIVAVPGANNAGNGFNPGDLLNYTNVFNTWGVLVKKDGHAMYLWQNQ